MFAFHLPTLLLSHHLHETMIHRIHAYSNAESARGGVWLRREREGGRGISFIASALLSDSKLAHLFCLIYSSLLFFLSLFSGPVLNPLLCLVSLLFHLLFSCQTHIARISHDLTESHSLHSCIVLLSSQFSFLAKYFGFWLLFFPLHSPPPLFLHTASGISFRLRWVFIFCFKRISARSEATWLWCLSPSSRSSPLTFVLSVKVGMIVQFYSGESGLRLNAAVFNIVTQCASEVAYLPLHISQTARAVCAVDGAAAAMKTIFAYLITLTCSLHSPSFLVFTPLLHV